MLSDHEHVIDCIVWAPTEACRTIENANYSNGFIEENKDGGNEETGMSGVSDAAEEEK